jgi:oligopeptide transport system substrate-binding protein
MLVACSGHSSTSTRPVRGGTFRMGVARPSSLDPAKAATVEELLVARQLFGTLTVWDPGTLDPTPGLAAKWTATPDQKQWDFVLKPGIVFGNGRPITADDVKYTLQRIAAKGSGSTGADVLASMTDVVAAAPDTVRITLSQPWAELPSALGSPVFGIVPREAVEAPSPAFGEQPVGSGPFRIKTRSATGIVLERSPGSSSLVDGVDIRFFDDTGAAYRAFTAGQLDWSRVPPEEVDAAAARYGRSAFRTYLAELFYAFNLKSPTFTDVRFREAIVEAVDRQAIVRAIYHDIVRPLDGIVVEGVPGHQDNPCGPPCRHDPAAAKALLATLYPPPAVPPPVNLDFDDDVTQQAVAKAIQANLADVGITATLRPKPLKEYQQFAVSGQQELFRLGWIAGYPSPDAFLQPLFGSTSPSNVVGLASGPIDGLLGTARAEANPAKRVADYQAAERTIMALVPVIPIAQFQVPAVVTSRVHALRPTAAGTFDATSLWLTASKRR